MRLLYFVHLANPYLSLSLKNQQAHLGHPQEDLALQPTLALEVLPRTLDSEARLRQARLDPHLRAPALEEVCVSMEGCPFGNNSPSPPIALGSNSFSHLFLLSL